MIGHLQRMDDLEGQLRRTQQSSNLAEIDQELLKELLGQETVQELDHLKSLTKVLEKAGYIQKNGDRFELTPIGIRMIGQKAL